MNTMAKWKITGAICGIGLAGLANADTVYQNSPDKSIEYFGYLGTTAYGEVFTLSSAMNLSAWNFYTVSGAAGNLDLVISAWNGTTASGSVLYQSANFAYAGGAQDLSFTGINTSLAAGEYIAYATVAGVSDPTPGVVFSGSSGNGTIGDGFTFANTAGLSPQGSNVWYPVGSFAPGNLQFTADFKAVAAPEIDPASATSGITLLLGGLVVLRGRRSGCAAM